MKTFKLKNTQTRRLFVNMLFLFVSFLPAIAQAQGGQNDVTFNPSDNIAAQGPNSSVMVSTVQADNKILIAGEFTSYNGTPANKLARLTMDGKLDENFNVGFGADGLIKTIAVQSNNKVIIAGEFSNYNGTPINKIARLNEDGSLDTDFNPGVGANNGISKVIIQPDGKLLLAGSFTTYNDAPVHGIIRLNVNGEVDDAFAPAITDSLSLIYQIGLQADGKIIVAGKVRNYTGGMANTIEVIRLNKGGCRDHSFKSCQVNVGDTYTRINSVCIENNGNILLAGTINDFGNIIRYRGLMLRVSPEGEILNQKTTFWINALAVLKDGKIVADGFDYVEWSTIKRRVVRMHEDLTVDATFLLTDKKMYADPYESQIQTLSVQLDGKIIIGGNFSEINGLIANNIARLNTDGSFDHLFNQRTGANGTVLATAVQSNGRTLIGGEFSRYNYQNAFNIARIKMDGELDPSFNTGSGTNGNVYTIAIQGNGKILIGGEFTSYNGYKCSNIARLNPDGSYDPTFRYVTANGIVRKILIDRTGKILIAGDFTAISGISKTAIARINERGLVDKKFSPDLDITACVYDIKTTFYDKIYLAVNYKNQPELSIESNIIRLNVDGTKDDNFTIPSGLFYQINALSLNKHARIVAAGSGFYTEPWLDVPKGIVIQFNIDGSVDETFNYKGLETYLEKSVRTISVLNDNKIIIGGDFSQFESSYMNYIGLLNADGSVNTDFQSATNNSVYVTTVVANNKLLIGGAFTEYNAVVRNGIARITLPGSKKSVEREALVNVETPLEEQLLLYPNPATSTITVNNLPIGTVLKIFNITGKEMYNGIVSAEKSTIQLDDYSNGIYFMSADINGNKSTTKFVVNK